MSPEDQEEFDKQIELSEMKEVTYEEKINDKIATLYGDLPYRLDKDGNKIFNNQFRVSIEQLKMKLFAQAINYDPEVCDVVFADENENVRKEILEIPLGLLAIEASKRSGNIH